jgi:sugar phosphate isomerase/epimerase
VFVACSTLCFGKNTLEETVQRIGELRFSKVDLAIHTHGHHLKPATVVNDLQKTAYRLRSLNMGFAAFHVEIDEPDSQAHAQQLRAICHLARLVAAPLVTIPAPASGTDPAQVVEKLKSQVHIAEAEGVILTLETRKGTLTEDPVATAELCRRVRGLGITLDPSHYVTSDSAQNYDGIYPHVCHVRLRDTGMGPNEFQVRIGQGQIDYGKLIGQLERCHYDRALSVDIRDIPDSPYPIDVEVRKLKYLLESLV